MKTIIEFTLEFNRDRRSEFGGLKKKIPEEVSKELYRLRRTIKGKKTGECYFMKDEIYSMDANDALLKPIYEFAEAHPEEIEFCVYAFDIQYTSDEVKNAIAFEPNFYRHYCREYEDIDSMTEECKFCYNTLREPSIWYAQPKGYIQKAEYGVMRMLEEYDVWIVTEKLGEVLMQEGFPKKYFKPVISKRKKKLGYQLTSDSMLPESSYKSPIYKYWKTCSQCGLKKYDFKGVRHYELPVKLSEEGEKALKPVNITSETYLGTRLVVISKELHDRIKYYDPTAQFIPIFRE